jgi:hypothetical protein
VICTVCPLQATVLVILCVPEVADEEVAAALSSSHGHNYDPTSAPVGALHYTPLEVEVEVPAEFFRSIPTLPPCAHRGNGPV